MELCYLEAAALRFRSAMLYISFRRSAGAANLDPLFVTTNGTVLYRIVFFSKLRIVLSSLGFDATKYRSATSAANANIPDHLIKTLGRWSTPMKIIFETPNCE